MNIDLNLLNGGGGLILYYLADDLLCSDSLRPLSPVAESRPPHTFPKVDSIDLHRNAQNWSMRKGTPDLALLSCD